jgi:hypothetical protein
MSAPRAQLPWAIELPFFPQALCQQNGFDLPGENRVLGHELSGIRRAASGR